MSPSATSLPSSTRRAGVIDRDIKLPPGYFLEWGGQFENLERSQKRLALVVPLTLLLIFVPLWFSLGNCATC